MTVDIHWRLEPSHGPLGDLERGFQAELGDPLWMLGRQWQMGEHEGENASSPLSVESVVSETPIDPPADRAGQDPRVIPAEAIVEGGLDDWWTIGRRIAIGLRAVSAGAAPPVDADTDPALVLRDLPEPYRGLSGHVYDGRALARNPGFDLTAILPPVPAHHDHWQSDQLAFRTSFPCGDTELRVDRHDGGDVDWWTVDAARALTDTAEPAGQQAMPGRFSYPGAPHPRYWQIEDRHVDIGGFPPDRSHFATLLLIELIATHSDDWFTFPVLTRAGHVLSLHEGRVRDSFGDSWPAPGGAWPPLFPDEWALFRVRGLEPAADLNAPRRVPRLAVWPTAATPLAGPVLEDVVLGVDEDANLLWAVEQRVDGVETVQPPSRRPAGGTTGASLVYQPTSAVPSFWHPYEIRAVETDAATSGRRRFVQGRLADLRTDGPSALRPAPRATCLNVPAGIHEIEPATVPTTGLRLEQRFILARGTDGRPVLWLQRQRWPLLGPPSHALRFDVMEPAAPKAPPRSGGSPPTHAGLPPPPDDPLVAMVQPGGEPEEHEPDLTPNREALPDPPLAAPFDPASLPALSLDPGVSAFVVFAQSLLNAAGALPVDALPLPPDGRFDTRTGEAVSAFQQRQGQPVTGEIGPATWAGLLTFAPFAILLPGEPGPSGPTVARAQAVLNRIGQRPLLDVTGALDGPTADALRAFQSSRLLPATGGLDPATWLALSAASRAQALDVLLALLFRYDRDRVGTAQPIADLVSAEVLDQRSPAIDSAASFGEHGGFWMELWDDTGQALYRKVLTEVIPLRRGTSDQQPHAAPPVERRGAFSLVFPRMPGAVTLALFGPRLDVDDPTEPSSVIFTFDLTTL